MKHVANKPYIYVYIYMNEDTYLLISICNSMQMNTYEGKHRLEVQHKHIIYQFEVPKEDKERR